MREDNTNWFCSRVMDGEISYSLPVLKELETTHSACGFQRGSRGGNRVLLVSDSRANISRRSILYFPPVLIHQLLCKGKSGHSPGRGAQDTEERGDFESRWQSQNKTISSFLTTLTLSVTCGQGWQVIIHSGFYQIKQINLMGLSYILDFPVNGCDLPI